MGGVAAQPEAPPLAPPCPCSPPRVSIKFIWLRAARGLLGGPASANQEARASGARSGGRVLQPGPERLRRLQCRVRVSLPMSFPLGGLSLNPGFRGWAEPGPHARSHAALTARSPHGSRARLTPATQRLVEPSPIIASGSALGVPSICPLSEHGGLAP